MTRFHDRQPGLADLQREICTFRNLCLNQLHGISIRKKPQARSRNGACGPAFAAQASGGRMSDAPEFGRIRVRLRVWAQALIRDRGASRERVWATMQQDHTTQHRTT